MKFHCLSSFNPETKEAICSICGPTKTIAKGGGKRMCISKHKEYRRKWEKTPGGAAYKRRHNGSKHREHVGMICERCGYRAGHLIEMDGHHKDWNHDNNDPSNIETLCAICHRLVHRGLEKLIEARKVNSGILTPTEPQKAVESKETDLEKHAAKVLVQCWKNMNSSGNGVTPEDMVNSLKGQNTSMDVRALLEDNDRLTNELNRLNQELDSLKLADSDNPQIAFLLAEVKTLKAKIKEYEQTYL